MSFPAWCACHAFDVRQRLDARLYAFRRRQFAADARAAHAAMLARFVAHLPPGIARDIADWRVDA